MSSRFKRVEEPKIEERFDYAEEVRRQIDRCLLAFSNDDGTEYNRKILENTVLALENMIPTDDRDKQLKKELKKAMEIEYVDNRNLYCGIKVGPIIKEGPKKNIKEVSIMLPHPYFRACFNMFVRLKVVVRRSDRA